MYLYQKKHLLKNNIWDQNCNITNVKLIKLLTLNFLYSFTKIDNNEEIV